MLSQLYKKNYLPYLILAFVSCVSTIILWLPFIIKTSSINRISTPNLSFETVLKNWDGPLYIIPAKTGYDTNNQILKDNPMGFEEKYFAAHLPLYPLTLKLFAPFVGYPKSTVLSTLLTTILSVCFFYYFVKKLKLSGHPLLLSIVFLFITPRFFVVRSVGSPEPLFLLFILLSIYFFIDKRFFYTSLFGALATMTKTPGMLLFVTYSLLFIHYYLKEKKFRIEWLWILLIPIGLIVVFTLYYFHFGDFWAYFNSGDNLHLIFPPFSVFNFQKIWVDTGWLEEIIFIYFFYLLALIKLYPSHHSKSTNSHYELARSKSVEFIKEYKIRQTFFTYILVFFLSIISIQHRDISRYSLPLLPFALITFEEFFTSKKFLIALVLLLPAIYLYAWNFMLYNVAPIADWTPFL